MIKYAKIIDNETGLVEIGVGCPEAYYIEIGMTQLDVQESDIDNEWYLIGKCPLKSEEQKAEENKNLKLSELNAEINKIDKKRIRAICEPSIKDETTGETWLEYYTTQIQELREKIQNLYGE